MRRLELTDAQRSEAANAALWSVDVAATSIRIGTHPDSRVAMAIVTAGSLVVGTEVVLDGRTDPDGVALLMFELLQSAATTVRAWPRNVAVRDAGLAESLRRGMKNRQVRVTHAAALPDLDGVLGAMGQAGRDLGGFEGGAPASWQGWGLEPALVRDMFTAAAEYYSVQPWLHLDSAGVVDLRHNGEEWYACVLGSVGFGVRRRGIRRRALRVPIGAKGPRGGIVRMS